jgi:hypothetical protein
MILHLHIPMHEKKTPLEIYLIYLDNIEIYWIFFRIAT